MAEEPRQYQQVIYEEPAPKVARIVMNRPERLNALSPQLWAEIDRGLAAADSDPDVRAVVLTGTGRAFSAGADMSGGNLPPGGERPRRGLMEWYTTEMEELENCDHAYVFRNGRIVADLGQGEMTEQRIIQSSFEGAA